MRYSSSESWLPPKGFISAWFDPCRSDLDKEGGDKIGNTNLISD